MYVKGFYINGKKLNFYTHLNKDYKRLTGELKKGYWILGHVLVEESQHLGQVAYIRGMIKGLDN